MVRKVKDKAGPNSLSLDKVLIDILTKSRSWQEFCIQLVLDRELNRTILGAHLYRLNSRIELNLIASYGNWPNSVVRSSNLDEESIASVGILRGEAKFFPPVGSDQNSYASIPLEKGNVPNGSLVLVNCINSFEDFFSEKDLEIFPKVASMMMDGFPVRDGGPIPTSNESQEFLSNRQNEVLDFITQGLTNSQIAKRLNVSESTIRHDTMKIYRNLGLRNRAEVLENHHKQA
jgi:DNA-binding CsgD family transcriptional regulator